MGPTSRTSPPATCPASRCTTTSHEEGPITGADLLWFARGLAEGVAAVHAVGVLHRDVKPSNVLMEGRTPILIDFGLARVADDPKLTHTGWLLGTPGYLAPEILYGDDATAASDVHSWAATVAYAGTGRPPFGRGPSMAIMDRVRRGSTTCPACPATCARWSTAALDPDPARRPTLPGCCWPGCAPSPAGRRAPVPHRSTTDDPYTVPLALASQAHDRDDHDLRRRRRRTLHAPLRRSDDPWEPTPVPREGPPVAQRLAARAAAAHRAPVAVGAGR